LVNKARRPPAHIVHNVTMHITCTLHVVWDKYQNLPKNQFSKQKKNIMKFDNQTTIPTYCDKDKIQQSNWIHA